MTSLLSLIEIAQTQFRELLIRETSKSGLTKEQYVRFLTMQYHLTKGVQRHFYAAASHPELIHQKALRKFLVDFGNEEEPHYDIAAKDLRNMGEEPASIPFDVELWHLYFVKYSFERPFVRLGATCILENISEKSQDLISKFVEEAKYLNPTNTRFLQIHRHKEPHRHGEEILGALREANPTEENVKDLVEGAKNGTTIYFRMAGWALTGKTVE